MKRQPLNETIFEDLKKRIAAGEFQLDSKLPAERILAAQYQVSRIPIREALKRLEDVGIVSKNPGSGTTVISIPEQVSIADSNIPVINENTAFLETVRLRRLIESEAARAAARNATPEGIERIQYALFESISEIRKLKVKDENNFYEADLKFHQTIAAESGSQLLIDCLNAMPTLLEWQQHWSLSITTPKDEVISYHTKIFESILDKNEKQAYDSMYAHLSRVEELLLARNSVPGMPSISFTL